MINFHLYGAVWMVEMQLLKLLLSRDLNTVPIKTRKELSALQLQTVQVVWKSTELTM
jgi:hypothetical protein